MAAEKTRRADRCERGTHVRGEGGPSRLHRAKPEGAGCIARSVAAAGTNESLWQIRLVFRLISGVRAAPVPWRSLRAAVERRLVSKPPFHSLSTAAAGVLFADDRPIEETLFYGQRGKAGGRCAHGKRRHSSAGSHLGAAFLSAAGQADQVASARLLRSGHESRRD